MFEGCLLVSVSRCFAAITQSQWWLSCHLVSAALTPHHSSDERRVTTVIIGMLPQLPWARFMSGNKTEMRHYKTVCVELGAV